jgi:type VI secretion system protein ImpH
VNAALQQLRDEWSYGPLEILHKEACQFTLFAALRLIEQANASQPRLGESRHPHEDAVRLHQPPHLDFAPSDVKSLIWDEELERLILQTYSFGVFGPNGALPSHVTETAFERLKQHKDPALSDFINLLQHRLMALFYRGWANADAATNLDRPGSSDRFQQYLGSLIGLGIPASWQQDSVHDYAKFSRAAGFGSRTRDAEGLENILSGYFRVPVRVHSFVGEWVQVPSSWRTRLARRSDAEKLSRRSGRGGAALGSRAWQCAHKFEITLGPLTYEAFKSFLPERNGASALQELCDLVRLYTNDEWSWQLRLQLAPDEVPIASLGRQRAQLGRAAWLRSRIKAMGEVVIQGESIQTPRSQPDRTSSNE